MKQWVYVILFFLAVKAFLTIYYLNLIMYPHINENLKNAIYKRILHCIITGKFFVNKLLHSDAFKKLDQYETATVVWLWY